MNPEDQSFYQEPSLNEIVMLCSSQGLIQAWDTDGLRATFRIMGASYDLTVAEAQLMLEGVLLGYYLSQSGDDVSGAVWDD